MSNLFQKFNKFGIWKKVSELSAGMQIAVAEGLASPSRSFADSLSPSSQPLPNETGFLWDEIVSIKHVGREQVYDIEVEGTHNFVAGHLLNKATGEPLSLAEEKEIIDKDQARAKDFKFGGIIAHNTVIFENGNVGLGTTTPQWNLQIASSTKTQFALSDMSAGTDLKHWLFSSMGGNLYIGTSSDAYATSTISALTLNSNGYLGLGTTSPYAQLSVAGLIAGDLFNINSTTSTSTILSGLNVGSGALVYDYSSAITSIGSLETGNLNFETDAGAVSWADLPLSAAPAGTVESYTAYLAGTSTLTIYGTSNGSGGLASGPFVGIGTTSPYSKLAVVDETTALRDVFTISTTTSGLIFKVDSYGATYADGAYSGAGADYAEYFYTTDTDLKAGETVCIDLAENNAVKRCQRGHDNNVMGIVSTKPSIVGNNSAAVRQNPAHYAIVGMLGQVEAFVSAENGAIKVGDSLTSASSTPGYAMRADGGDSSVGVALEPLREGAGKIKVLISRRNKSLAVEEVEQLVVARVASMKIEDEVQRLITDAVNTLDLDPRIATIAKEEAGKLDAILTVNINDLSGGIANLRTQALASISDLNNQIAGINNELLSLRFASLRHDILLASTTAVLENIRIDQDGNLEIGKTPSSSLPTGQAGPLSGGEQVRIIDPTEIAASSTQAAFVVNQAGSGDIADFQTNGVSIMNIAGSGQVKIMGSLLVDGRIMLCTGGHCSDTLDAAVDETRADLGVEGKVVAGAFEGYCADGYAWVPGSAKYGTLPGFCVTADLMEIAPGIAKTDVSQGQAQAECQSIGPGYHLIGENEWLTMAENILQVAENDTDPRTAGRQLAKADSSSSTIAFKLTNDNVINNLAGAVAQWTNQNVTAAGLPVTASIDDWSEYSAVSDYKGLNMAPDYYLTDQNNGIGKIYVGSGSGLRGFVRGFGGIYGLDLSRAPDEQDESIGFRCAK